MSITLFRATENGVNVASGAFLASGDNYEIAGTPAADDQAHIDAGRLLPVPEPKTPSKPAQSGKEA